MNILKERERETERNDLDFRADYFAQRREDAVDRSMRERGYGYDDYRSDIYDRRDDGYSRSAYSDRYDYEDVRDYTYRRDDYRYEAPRGEYGSYYRSQDDYEVSGESKSAFEPVEFDAPARAKKQVRHGRSKFLIAVYFALVALIASLVITNVVMFNDDAVVEAETPNAEYSQEEIFSARTEDGTTVSLETDRLTGYEYDTTTNWFDEFCDMLSR